MEKMRALQFSFNGGVIADTFIGDYHYQQPRQERVSIYFLYSLLCCFTVFISSEQW